MTGHNPMADALDRAKTRDEVDEMEKSIRYLVQHMPGHGDYLARYCPAAS
jgi:tryptophan halogenase